MLGNTTDDEAFAIVATTGQLKTKAALDYETQTDYEVTVTATDSDSDSDSETDTIRVTINVRNVSVANGDTAVENSAPAFNDGPSTTRSVPENTAVKANIGAPVAARDVDRGDTLTYTLGDTTDDQAFAIDSMTGQLKTKDPLDYEEADPPKTSYMVTVTVTDSKDAEDNVDTTTVDDTITVTIMVTDVNDKPVFPDIIDPIRVDENTAAGTNIGSPVVATDDDADDTLTYTLSGTDAASFDIVATTGQLQTLAALDYETQSDYEVIVTATDTGSETDTIRVIIMLIDDATADDDAVVNSAPRFTEGPRAAIREVAEDAVAKTNIGNPVIATDTAGDTLTYGLSGTDAASFDIVDVEGAAGVQLQTKAALDFETKTDYEVTVTVTDGKDADDNVDATVDDTIRVTIMVTDENEAPMFPATIDPIVVAENTVAGANIGDPVVAMDVDDGDVLMYMLDDTHKAFFAIDPATGQLKTADPLANPLDYETKTDYEVTVTASDNDNTNDDAVITVIINVTNVSVANGDTAVANSAPAFNDGPSTTRSVPENTEGR